MVKAKADLIERLRADADYMAAPLTNDEPEIAATLREAATVIERLRRNFIEECESFGYGRKEAEEMLAMVESGEGEPAND